MKRLKSLILFLAFAFSLSAQQNGLRLNLQLPFTHKTAVAVTPAPTYIVASGGIYSEVNGYAVHTFTTSGTFVVSSISNGSQKINYLIVGGGGAGGGGTSSIGGGGGGGGLLAASNYSVTAKTYTITVGAGGTGVSNAAGNNGGISVFDNITALGGGGGGVINGSDGGSGGGTGNQGAGTPGLGTVGQGNDGGDGGGVSGGGGGAMQVGGARIGASYNGGIGGDGFVSTITGCSKGYSGGGGGAGYDPFAGAGGPGGLGGGGTGGVYTIQGGTPGTVNTGGGGGGEAKASNVAGENGGSGVVIISYPIAPVFNPADYGTVLTWLESGVGVTTVSGKVSLWADQSGNGNDAAQSTATDRPTFNPSGMNCLGTLGFDGTNDYMTFGTALGKPAYFCEIIVYSTTDISVIQRVSGSSNAAGAGGTVWGGQQIKNGGSNGTIQVYNSNGAAIAFGISDNALLVNNTPNIITTKYLAGEVGAGHIFNKGVQVPSSTALTSNSNGGSLDGYSIGRLGDYSADYFSGSIAEYIMFGGASLSDVPTDAEILTIANYYKTKFSIP